MLAWLILLPEWLERVLGVRVEAAQRTFGQMSARLLVVFCWGVLLMRLADRRLLGKHAGFDVVIAVMLGSVLSRAINGTGAFFPTLGVSGLLVALHHFTGRLASRSHHVSRWLKGEPRVLVEDGRVQEEELRRWNLSREDLEENIRLAGNMQDLAKVKKACLERNGSISVIKKQTGE